MFDAAKIKKKVYIRTEFGFITNFFSNKLKGNTVKIRDCPSNCKLCRKILIVLLKTTVHDNEWEGNNKMRVRRPAKGIN